jgi:hypothetical protein
VKILITIGVPILVKGVDGITRARIFERAKLVAAKFALYVKAFFIENDREIAKAKGFLYIAVGRLLGECHIAKNEWRSYFLKFGSEAAGQFLGEMVGNHATKLIANTASVSTGAGKVSSVPPLSVRSNLIGTAAVSGA